MYLKEKILPVLGEGSILLVVPPFVTTRFPILGPHILQSIARQMGFKTDILYLNLLLASIIGLEPYESISYGQPFRMLGERLFARSAHGLPPLGKSPELCLEPVTSVFGKNHQCLLEEFEYKYINSSDFKLEAFFEIEETCKSFIEEAAQIIAAGNYMITGCSTNWEQINCCVALFSGIKKKCPGMITLMGGSNCEGEMAEGIASLSDSTDYIFSGEGETSFTDFLEKFSTGHLPSQRIIVGKPLNDLDCIPLPDYENYDTQRRNFLRQNYRGEWSIGYETSRGCWWRKCYFCGLNGVDRGHFRQKTVKKVLTDLDAMPRHYPDQGIVMVDKVLPVSYQNDLLPILSEKKGFAPLGYEIRPDLSLKDLVQLKNANVLGIKPGIEALSTGLLELMNKGISAWQNILLLRNAASLGMYVGWNLLWGFPHDQVAHYEEMLNILPLLHHLCPPEVFRHICIDRFSPYFEQSLDFQINNLRPWSVYHTVYPGRAEVNKLAYRFIGDYPCGSHDNPRLIREIADQLTLWKNRWKTSTLVMIPFESVYMIYDDRIINGQSKTHVLDHSQAREIMITGAFDNPGNRQWAVEQKLGIMVDSLYVPLVTASAALLLQFEEKSIDDSQ